MLGCSATLNFMGNGASSVYQNNALFW